ncbi:RHS repeat protein [Pseudomonas sp. SWRI99]|uniref:RHS repeat-associated core domain-containing protein n=1 Tax=Pseudomonas sp. SWRI99 TaxID=2745506 RepID=UPI0016473EA6|nr:RHS repeat protein [Pseudomonas sp. SWRI99]MBC3775404.1 RHS repeat protein [Pseudomonas sp. SWRI99]
MHRHTPMLAVIEPRGAAVREVSYFRRSGLDELQTYVWQTVHDLPRRASHTRDPRLFLRFQNDDTSPANQTSITTLSGASLLSVNVDAGWRLTLTGASGQPLESWDQKLNHRRVQYDAWLRPTFVFDRSAGESEHRSECLSYADASLESARHNRCGQLVRHDDAAGSAYFTEFGLNGAPIEQSRRFLKELNEPDWPEEPSKRDALLEDWNAITGMGYNASGDLIRHVDAQGNQQLLRQTVAGELARACLKPVGANGYTTLVADIRYNASGQIEQQTAGNGVVTRSVFDSQNGRLNSLAAQAANEPVLQDLAYDYDPVGKLLSITDSAQSIHYFRNQRVAPLTAYGYDTLGQLIKASGRQRIRALSGPQLPEFISPADPLQLENYQQTFDYDSAGNLCTLQHTADSGSRCERTAVALTSNRSLPYTVASERPDEEEIARRYDANGNLNLLQTGQNLLWDKRNQLRQVHQVIRKNGPNDSECYFYDCTGQRLRKIRTAHTPQLTRTHETRYLPGLEIRTTPEETLHIITVQAGRCTVQVLHWERGRPSRIADNQHRYILTDHLGSSSLELDFEAHLISQESYYAYGATAWWAGRDEVEASYRTVRYSRQERDATGLYYYGFRYYMPWRQRWLSADPGGTHDGLNLYAMVGGNPVGYVDLQGLSRWETAKAMIWAGGFDFAAKVPAAAIGYLIKAANPASWVLAVAGGASAAINGAITGAAWVAHNQNEDIGRLRRYAERSAGALGGAVLTAAPVAVEHFFTPGLNLAAIDQITSLGDNFGFEFFSQFEASRPNNDWTGTPPRAGINAEIGATVLTKGVSKLIDYNLFGPAQSLSVSLAQEVLYPAATKGAVAMSMSFSRSYFPEEAPYQESRDLSQFSVVKQLSNVAGRDSFSAVPRLAAQGLQLEGVSAVISDGVRETVNYAVNSGFQIMRNAYKRDIKSGLQKMVKTNRPPLADTKVQNYGAV